MCSTRIGTGTGTRGVEEVFNIDQYINIDIEYRY